MPTTNSIAIVWDFDGTLTPIDSTTLLVEKLDTKGDDFWSHIKGLRGDQDKPEWEHVLASDAPIWMWALSRIAFANEVPLNKQLFRDIAPNIKLYPNVHKFLTEIKRLEEQEAFKRADIEINHFIVSAGLRELIEEVFHNGLIRWVWGCRYEIVKSEDNIVPESVPVYCMDETAKTRALFEISKGSFLQPLEHSVNKKISDDDLFCRFEDMIYVGDGFSDVPSLSLVRGRRGFGILVTNPKDKSRKRMEKTRQLRKDRRADLITNADYSLEGELFQALKARCIQIQQKYAAYKMY